MSGGGEWRALVGAGHDRASAIGQGGIPMLLRRRPVKVNMNIGLPTLVASAARGRSELLIALTGWVIIAAGTLGLVAALYERHSAARSAGWPTTQGEVVVSWVYASWCLADRQGVDQG